MTRQHRPKWGGLICPHCGGHMEQAPAATKLESRRRASGMSQEAVAHEAGISTSHLSRLERGLVNPSFTVAFAVARALDAEPSELFSDLLTGEVA